MSTRKRRTAEGATGPQTSAPATRTGLPAWAYVVIAAASLLLAFQIYSPALNGEFLFDDDYLPFLLPEVQDAPLRSWLGVRPLLMFTYWLNYRYGGLDPFPYHAVNVVLHALNAVLIWIILTRLLRRTGETSGHATLTAGCCAALFLLHPANTEAVAYVASRSETLSIFFFLSAYALFVYAADTGISIWRAAGVLILYGCAVSVKEHTVVLPGLLILTDYFISTPFQIEGIRRNLRLYIPVLLGAGAGVLAVWRLLSTADSAGFRVSEFTWYQYLFTQFRVIWTYIRLYLLPVGLNGDYVYPISRSLLDPQALLALTALIGVSALAWRVRRKWPLIAFGWFGFLLLLAPTSSVVPIRDVIVERRLYLPFLCLLALTAAFVRRWRNHPGMLAAAGALVLSASAYAAWQRNHVWDNPLSFWSDAVKKSPDNARARFQLAYAQWQNNKCTEAVSTYAETARLQEPDDRLLIDWALALECAGKPDEAIAKLQQAQSVSPSALVQAQIGMIYGKRERFDEALDALDKAEKLDPAFEMTYVYRGNVHMSRGETPAAAEQYRRALAINPKNETARKALTAAEGQLR